MDVAAAKEAMRKSVRAAVAALPPARRALEEDVVAAAILSSPEWQESRTVALYAAKAPEFSVVSLALAAWRAEKRVLFPRVAGPRDLTFHPASSWSEFRVGAFGIKEPTSAQTVDVGEADLVVVPAVAFDRSGGRLGQGGGFYDAVLAGTRRSWVVGFDCQLVPAVPMEAHDRRASAVWCCAAKSLLD